MHILNNIDEDFLKQSRILYALSSAFWVSIKYHSDIKIPASNKRFTEYMGLHLPFFNFLEKCIVANMEINLAVDKEILLSFYQQEHKKYYNMCQQHLPQVTHSERSVVFLHENILSVRVMLKLIEFNLSLCN